MSINRVNISGNLTRDPEMRSTQGGTTILTFGVAVNDRRRNPSTGEWEDYPNYVDCVVFGARAEPLSRYLAKGTKVAIEGKLRWSQWEKDGMKRSKIEVIVDEVEFLSARKGEAQAPAQQYAAPQNAPQAQQFAPAPQQFVPQNAPQVAPQYTQNAPQAPQNVAQAPQNAPQIQQLAPQNAPQAQQFAPAPQQNADQNAAQPELYDADVPF